MSTVTQLKIVNKSSKPKPVRRTTKAMRRQVLSAAGIGAVAVTLTGLSLHHLASGIEIVTSSPTIESYAMAVGIDMGFISAEIAQLFASNERMKRIVSKFAKPTVVGTMIASAAMNAFAFSSHVTGYMIAPAVILGVAIPAMIYAFTRIGGALYIDCNNRS